MLPELIEAGAKPGWIDQMMIAYNFRTMDGDKLKKAVDVASKANLGIVAMKTQGGAKEFKAGENEPKMNALIEKGFKVHQAAIKAVLNDERIHAAVSEMTNFDELREHGLRRSRLTPKEARLLEEHRTLTANQLLPRLRPPLRDRRQGRPVATVLRYYRYYESIRQARGSPGPLPGPPARVAGNRRPQPRGSSTRRARTGSPSPTCSGRPTAGSGWSETCDGPPWSIVILVALHSDIDFSISVRRRRSGWSLSGRA